MRQHMGRIFVVASVAALGLAVESGFAGGEPEKAVKKTFDKMIAALQANDRDAFVADASDAVKKGTTAETMDALSKQIAPRLKKGFESKYLGQLKQFEHQVHLWKLTFKDDGDDILVRVAFKDGKVGGFFLQ